MRNKQLLFIVIMTLIFTLACQLIARDSNISTPTQVNEILILPTQTDSATTTPTSDSVSTMVSEKDGMTLVFVPAGEFTMGSNEGNSDEQPIHKVYLDAYWIDQTEVTNAMYAQCVNANHCDPPNNTSSYSRSSYFGNSEFDKYPVIYVSWNDAKAYCSWADRRLPTEAEWEKAARGTNGNIYPWGNETLDSGLLLNYNNEIGETTEVGNYPQGASIYGALDMSGNVWEWVEDWYDASYYQNSPSQHPTGSETGQYRVLRGGSWGINYYYVRSAVRLWSDPSYAYNDFGIRCSRSQP